MNLVSSAIRGDLEGLFPEIFKGEGSVVHQPYLDDYVAIGQFLSGPSSVQGPLKTLELRLEERLFERLGYNQLTWKERIKELQRPRVINDAKAQFSQSTDRFKQRTTGNTPSKDPAFSKLLTSELAQREQEWGFNLFVDQYGHPKAEMIMPLKADQFRQQLQEQRPFKDPTIGPDHGEFTHRIQWYLIGVAGIVRQPAEVYKQIGLVAWQGSVFTKNGATNFGLWDALCDRQPPGAPGLPIPFPFYKMDATDFRCPEALLTWLIQPSQLQTYPLLSSFLKARKEKRLFVQNQTSFNNPLAEHYIALKVFNKPYTQLSKTDQERVDQFILGGQQNGLLAPNLKGPGYQPRF
ncbi:MAG: hypothetical protein H6974_12405 [Gammaproteobacteria bacterium]|nr:hypothetical protein [Gammaproteobacteria bacterium]